MELTHSTASRLSRAVVVSALALALITWATWMVIERRRLPTARIESPNGTLVVEVAKTPGARSAGLSNRERLNVDGLLLEWETRGRHPIWMADMRFSLDLVWLDPDGRVLAVLANVPPCRLKPCQLYEPDQTDRSVAVLEIRAGAAARHQITAGALLRYSTDPQ